jgi:hypothetical protein
MIIKFYFFLEEKKSELLCLILVFYEIVFVQPEHNDLTVRDRPSANTPKAKLTVPVPGQLSAVRGSFLMEMWICKTYL